MQPCCLAYFAFREAGRSRAAGRPVTWGRPAGSTKEGQAEMGLCCSSGFRESAYTPWSKLLCENFGPRGPPPRPYSHPHPIKAPLPLLTAVHLDLHGRVDSFCCVCFQVKTFPFLSDSIIPLFFALKALLSHGTVRKNTPANYYHLGPKELWSVPCSGTVFPLFPFLFLICFHLNSLI